MTPSQPPGAPPFLQAVLGSRPTRVPVWLPPMRTAAPDERELGAWPERVAVDTAAPVRAFETDAATLAIDPRAPLRLAGVPIEVGPDGVARLAEPIRSGSDVLRLRPIDPASLAPLRAATGLAVAELGPTPVVAIAGGPFTLAAALVEGGPSADVIRTRTLMYADPHTWAALANWCADVAGAALRDQVLSGASAVHLADPHLGALSRNDVFKRVLPHTQRALSHLRGLDVPIVLSGEGTGEMLDLLARAGADAIVVDRRIPLDTAAERVDGMAALVGGIDPALLAAPGRILEAHVADVLARGAAASAHVLGLGGPLPHGTSPDVLEHLVRLAHGGV